VYIALDLIVDVIKLRRWNGQHT